MKFCHKQVGRKSLAKFCMNRTHEVRERAHFRPVYEISIIGAYGISFVGHLQLGRVNSQMATQQEGEGVISKGEESSQENRAPFSPINDRGINFILMLKYYREIDG